MEKEEQAFRNVVRDFWLQLRSKMIDVLEFLDIVVLFYCDHGKHRSVAAATLFAYCLYKAGFLVNPSDGFVLKLNRPHWRPNSCGGMECHCEGCEKPVDQRSHVPAFYSKAFYIFTGERLHLLGW